MSPGTSGRGWETETRRKQQGALLRNMSSKAQKVILWGPEELAGAHRVLDGLELGGSKPWMLVIKLFYESPSDRQRGYYRSTVLKTLCDHYGYSEEEMHEVCKQKFGPKARIEIDGEAFDVVAFSTGNEGEIAAMNFYMTQIIEWAGSEGVYIPPPREKWERKVRVAA